MSGLDIWALIAAIVASAALAIRSNMLRPTFRTLVDAPVVVWLSLSLLSIACAGYGIMIIGGAHVLAREAAILTALAISAVILLLNLRGQIHTGRDEERGP